MKFARYLQDTQTPEWQRAYIDYRRLKKHITVIRKEREEARIDTHNGSQIQPGSPRSDGSDLGFRAGVSAKRLGKARIGGLPLPVSSQNSDPLSVDNHANVSQPLPSTSGVQRFLQHTTTLNNSSSPAVLPLRDLLPRLSTAEAAFLTLLDSELDKVESFYLDREREFFVRSRTLEEQLRELKEHRRLFYVLHPAVSGESTWLNLKKTVIDLRSRLYKKREVIWRHKRTVSRETGADARSIRPLRRPSPSDGEGITVDGSGSGSDGSQGQEGRSRRRSRIGKQVSSSQGHASVSATASGVRRHGGAPDRAEVPGKVDLLTENVRTLDPNGYVHAKKSLKAAVMEHYRDHSGLEVLNDYRILNLTGFRKALKKFEKVTKIHVMQAYTKEKIEPCAFASGRHLSQMIKEMEELFAAQFEHGDKKKAMEKLRVTQAHSGRHFSAFRAGILLGLAMPAFASGLYAVFQEETRRTIPGWATLLFIYGVFLIPTLFSIFITLNLVAWSRSRINYVFIFDLDVRTRLDHREYLELPALLFALLVYSFWLSFHRIASGIIDPTRWPLIWLGVVVIFIINPLPIFRRSSRWWLLKSIARQLISGTTHVEFTDFWMGDQFCSLGFTLSNLYLVACVYGGDFFESARHCQGPAAYWPISFLLFALPLFLRLLQSVRRYVDSKLITHLINGGKYGSGIIAALFYAIWRHNGHPGSLVLWCLTNTVYAIYASAWDFLMDWSVMAPHATHAFLRSELVYTNYIPMYYFAIISNILLRFIWVIYIPTRGPNMLLRSFIAALLEMFRRWQWNFYRLENEHLGNMDQYRVTREVPLPYSIDQEEDASDEDRRKQLRWLGKSRRSLSPATHPAPESIKLHEQQSSRASSIPAFRQPESDTERRLSR